MSVTLGSCSWFLGTHPNNHLRSKTHRSATSPKNQKTEKIKRACRPKPPTIETLTSFERGSAAAEKAAHERDEEDGDEGMTAAQIAHAEEQPGADGDEDDQPAPLHRKQEHGRGDRERGRVASHIGSPGAEPAATVQDPKEERCRRRRGDRRGPAGRDGRPARTSRASGCLRLHRAPPSIFKTEFAQYGLPPEVLSPRSAMAAAMARKLRPCARSSRAAATASGASRS